MAAATTDHKKNRLRLAVEPVFSPAGGGPKIRTPAPVTEYPAGFL